MNFIEDTIFPHSSDSLRKECNTALKTSPRGSKTTFLPIKLQQSIIQAAMYAASELENELKKCGTTRISKVLKIRDMKLWVLSILIVSTIFVPIKRLKHFLSIVSMCCVDIQGSEYIHIEKQETDSKQ